MSDEFKKYAPKLDFAVKSSGLADFLKKPVNKEYREQMENRYWDKYKDSTREEADFFILQAVVRKVLKDDLLWMMRFISDPDKVDVTHEHIYNFFKYGPDSLPPEYMDAVGEQGGYFQWNPKATRELILVPRGIGKTTIWHGGRAIHNIINNPEYKWLMVHSDKKRVLGNLKQTKSLMFNGRLALVFPNIFAETDKEYLQRGTKITQEKVNLVKVYEGDDDVVALSRKEDTITLGAPGVSRTGWHFEGALADDLVTKETSVNEDATTKISEYLDELEGLEEYHVGNDFKVWLTGTNWWENNAYDKMHGREDTSIYQMPARWVSRKGKCFLSKELPDDKIDRKIAGLRVWGESQMLMISRKFANNNSSVGFNENLHVIEDPEGELVKDLEKRLLRVQVCDPAYSTKDKREGDKKSRFTITNFLCDETTSYIYDGFSSFGENIDSVSALNLEYGVKNDIDFFIQDAQGTQGTLFDRTYDIMRMQLPYLRKFKMSSPQTSSQGKMDVALEVLKDYFVNNSIKVIRTKANKEFIDKVIAQLLRRDKGMDIIDTIVYCHTGLSNGDTDRENEIRIALSRRMMGQRKRREGNNLLKSIFKGVA